MKGEKASDSTKQRCCDSRLAGGWRRAATVLLRSRFSQPDWAISEEVMREIFGAYWFERERNDLNNVDDGHN